MWHFILPTSRTIEWTWTVSGSSLGWFVTVATETSHSGLCGSLAFSILGAGWRVNCITDEPPAGAEALTVSIEGHSLVIHDLSLGWEAICFGQKTGRSHSGPSGLLFFSDPCIAPCFSRRFAYRDVSCQRRELFSPCQDSKLSKGEAISSAGKRTPVLWHAGHAWRSDSFPNTVSAGARVHLTHWKSQLK